jgi:hypothetical protein
MKSGMTKLDATSTSAVEEERRGDNRGMLGPHLDIYEPHD